LKRHASCRRSSRAHREVLQSIILGAFIASIAGRIYPLLCTCVIVRVPHRTFLPTHLVGAPLHYRSSISARESAFARKRPYARRICARTVCLHTHALARRHTRRRVRLMRGAKHHISISPLMLANALCAPYGRRKTPHLHMLVNADKS